MICAEQPGDAQSDDWFPEIKEMGSMPISVELQSEALPCSEMKPEIMASSQDNDATNGLLPGEEGPDDREESVGTSQTGCDAAGTDFVQGGAVKQERDDGVDNVQSQIANRVLLEKMVEANERMMGLMADLVERNERQTRMLSSLSNSKRVEQLEKAFMCDKLRRKRNGAVNGVTTADCCENHCPNNKKSAKR